MGPADGYPPRSQMGNKGPSDLLKLMTQSGSDHWLFDVSSCDLSSSPFGLPARPLQALRKTRSILASRTALAYSSPQPQEAI